MSVKHSKVFNLRAALASGANVAAKVVVIEGEHVWEITRADVPEATQ